MRLLGMDYGKKRIGLALGDTETKLAGPLQVLENKPGWLDELADLVHQESIEALVIGIPRPLSDQMRETDQAKEIRQAIDLIKSRIDLPVHEQNETWSSVEAARQTKEIGGKGKRDDLAAAIILQAWLDSHALSS